MAPVVAVAGGTGGLGRTIVEAIIETKKFEVVILARQVPFTGVHSIMT